MEPSASSSRLTFSAGNPTKKPWEQVSSRSPLVAADVVYVALAHLGLASEGSEAFGSLEVWVWEVEDCVAWMDGSF